VGEGLVELERIVGEVGSSDVEAAGVDLYNVVLMAELGDGVVIAVLLSVVVRFTSSSIVDATDASVVVDANNSVCVSVVLENASSLISAVVEPSVGPTVEVESPFVEDVVDSKSSSLPVALMLPLSESFELSVGFVEEVDIVVIAFPSVVLTLSVDDVVDSKSSSLPAASMLPVSESVGLTEELNIVVIRFWSVVVSLWGGDVVDVMSSSLPVAFMFSINKSFELSMGLSVGIASEVGISEIEFPSVVVSPSGGDVVDMMSSSLPIGLMFIATRLSSSMATALWDRRICTQTKHRQTVTDVMVMAVCWQVMLATSC
jgi:hypothetical protein